MLGEAVGGAEAGEVTLQSKGLKEETNTLAWGLLMALQLGGASAEIHVWFSGLETLLSGIFSVSLDTYRHEALDWAVDSGAGWVSRRILVVGVTSSSLGAGAGTWPAAVVTAPAPLASEACAGADGAQILLLPLLSRVVRLPIIVARGLMRLALEFPFSVSKTRAAQQLAVLFLVIPLLSDLVVHTVVVAPLRRVTSEVTAAKA